jgi:hypothetical protein
MIWARNVARKGEQECVQDLSGSDNLEQLEVVERIILKCILQNWNSVIKVKDKVVPVLN